MYIICKFCISRISWILGKGLLAGLRLCMCRWIVRRRSSILAGLWCLLGLLRCITSPVLCYYLYYYGLCAIYACINMYACSNISKKQKNKAKKTVKKYKKNQFLPTTCPHSPTKPPNPSRQSLALQLKSINLIHNILIIT